MNRIDLTDAEISYIPNFLDKSSADNYFKILLKGLNWKAYPIKIFGKEYLQPRLVAFYGDKGLTYSYSNSSLTAELWTEELKHLQQKIENQTGIELNSVLANLYRNGNDSNGWHADNESSLGKNPVIASLSLGQERVFMLKHNTKNEKFNIQLEHGSLLLMAGTTQHFYKHQIPKTKKSVSERINLTFRTLMT